MSGNPVIWYPQDGTEYLEVNDENPLPVQVSSSRLPSGGDIIAGTAPLATTVARSLHAGLACREVLLQNDPDNTVDVLVGDSQNQVLQLRPGDILVLPVRNASLVWVKNASSTTQSVNWVVSV